MPFGCFTHHDYFYLRSQLTEQWVAALRRCFNHEKGFPAAAFDVSCSRAELLGGVGACLGGLGACHQWHIFIRCDVV